LFVLRTLCAVDGVSHSDELRRLFRQFFPDEELPPRAALRLDVLAADIRAKLG
jgi:hypothetical protein